MRHCEACDCQLPDEHTSCPHCGGALADLRPDAENDTGSDAENMVLIASLDAFESHRLLERLTDAGISFAVVSDAAARRFSGGGTRGFAGVNVVVPADQALAAREIQQAVLRETLPDLPDDFAPPEDGAETCPACAAPLADDARECAECGLEFPDAGP